MTKQQEIFTESYLKQIGCRDNKGVRREFSESVMHGQHDYATEAMDEWAKQQAIAFSAYIGHLYTGEITIDFPVNKREMSWEELYAHFIKHQQQTTNTDTK